MELGKGTSVKSFLGPVYVRGEAYLRLNDGEAAATEFQKFMDHYGLVANFPWERWRGSAWHARMPLKLRLIPLLARRLARHTKTFSPSGKMPIPTYPSTSKPRQSTET